MLRRLRIENLVLIREAELVLGPGLTVVTGETGAGKTILTQAIGLLLGARGEPSLVGPSGTEAYVEAELDLPDGLLDEDGLEAVRELRPADEPGVVVARRVFADGRSRAYVWGRAIPREDAALLVERLVAMSGQFEQRRLARPSHQLDLLDAYCGEEQLRRRQEVAAAWRELQTARRRREELARAAGDRAARLGELTALVGAAEGLEPGSEDELRAERERLRNAAGLAAAAAEALEALAPEQDGEGAADLAARAARALAPAAGLAPELSAAADELADASVRLREVGSSLRAFLGLLETEPGRLEQVEDRLAAIGSAKRRFRAATLGDLLELARAAAGELAAVAAGANPLEQAEAALAATETRYGLLAEALAAARREAAGGFAAAVRSELASLGVGDGDLLVELSRREPGPSGGDEAAFLIRANPGLPFAPVATTASGGELSRIALALRAVAHARAGEPTLVFDEIDAGIGGTTAHAVAEALGRLSVATQVVTITHLPQVAEAAARHFRVEKVPGDPTHTRIQLLSAQERREELERMLGGKDFLELVSSASDRRKERS